MSGFEKVTGSNTYIKPADLADREVEGTFTGIITGQFGPNYKIKTKDGDVVVNGSGGINYQMQNVAEGEYIRFEYKGKKKLAGGKSCHDIDVLRKKA